jgi:hypothetical protein
MLASQSFDLVNIKFVCDGEMYQWSNVPVVKCTSGETYLWVIVLVGKCQWENDQWGNESGELYDSREDK